MRSLTIATLLFGAPFWEAGNPAGWSPAQLKRFLTDSPWVQSVGPAPVVQVFLASAQPIQDAEAEVLRRGLVNPLTGVRPSGPPDLDYMDYLRAHRDAEFVLAIPYPTLAGLGQPGEEKRMESECVLRVGRKRYPMVGHFPPTPSDPVLRLIFPRVVTPEDRNAAFDLYLPGLSQPSRMLEFRVGQLIYRGKLEM